jgi:hypothetical protein
MTISFIFLLLAFICFICASIPPINARVNLIGLGLAFWVLTLLIGPH